jgi:hypothetical protein
LLLGHYIASSNSVLDVLVILNHQVLASLLELFNKESEYLQVSEKRTLVDERVSVPVNCEEQLISLHLGE